VQDPAQKVRIEEIVDEDLKLLTDEVDSTDITLQVHIEEVE